MHFLHVLQKFSKKVLLFEENFFLRLGGLSPADFISLTDFNPALSTFNAQPLYSYQQAALERYSCIFY